MPRGTAATINRTLTNYAQGHMNDIMAANQVANTLCPRVQVTGAAGQFKKFSDINSFQVYNTLRGLGGAAARIAFDATDDQYNCKPHALEVTVDDHERDLAGSNDALASALLDQGKVRALLNGTGLSYAKRVVDFVGSNTTPVADRGNWSNANIDPVDQIDEQLLALSTACGSTMGISVTMGLDSWDAFRKHPKVKARCTGVQVAGISKEQAGGLFLLPLANFVIGALSYDQAKLGQATSNKKQVLAGRVYLTYSVASPTLYDPSAFKCFTTGQGNIEAVRTYRDESSRSDVHAIDWSEDIKLTSAQAVKRLDIT